MAFWHTHCLSRLWDRPSVCLDRSESYPTVGVGQTFGLSGQVRDLSYGWLRLEAALCYTYRRHVSIIMDNISRNPYDYPP